MFNDESLSYSLLIKKEEEQGYSCSIIKTGSSTFPGPIINILTDTPELGISKIEEYLTTGKFEKKPESDFRSNENPSASSSNLAQYIDNPEQSLIIHQNVYRDRYNPLGTPQYEPGLFIRTTSNPTSEEFVKPIDFNQILSMQTTELNDDFSNNIE